MAAYFISQLYQEFLNIRREYNEITDAINPKMSPKFKMHMPNIRIYPYVDWNSGLLWYYSTIINNYYIDFSLPIGKNLCCTHSQKWFMLCIRKNAEEYPKDIIKYFVDNIQSTSISNTYKLKTIPSIAEDLFDNCNREGFYFTMGIFINRPMLVPLLRVQDGSQWLDVHQYEELQKITDSCYKGIFHFQEERITKFNKLQQEYLISSTGIIDYLVFLLENSFYSFIFNKQIEIEFQETTSTAIIDYRLPTKNEVPNEVLNNKVDWCRLAQTKEKKLYEMLIYSITLRTIAEICHYDEKKYIKNICFNGIIIDRSLLTGQMEEKYILSINVNREQIESLNLEFIDPKECFKHLKGVSASKLYEQTEIQPIITPSFNDKRIVKAKNIETNQYTNLAEMDWEEFEHLVRQVFEWEFSDKGGEVNVTQSSRDGGVDAIVYDPDPIRGGKIIIQAKRYTNTVPVSAVRDLYGTIINEGANKGILITTSDYGPDSYKFAQGKPITLLNGGHLLYLMEKHGRHARIDIQEAKDKTNRSN